MAPDALHEPETPTPWGTLQIATAAPVDRSNRFSVSPATKATARLSGDQKTDKAPSVPAIGVDSVDATSRFHRRRPDAESFATNINCRPFGDNAKRTLSTS